MAKQAEQGLARRRAIKRVHQQAVGFVRVQDHFTNGLDTVKLLYVSDSHRN